LRGGALDGSGGPAAGVRLRGVAKWPPRL
jgi:hypothetical protein